MKFNRIVLSIILLTCSFAFAKPVEVPEWYLNIDKVYPNSEYIAQKGSGKKADEAKNEASANISLYFDTTVNAVRESNFQSLQLIEQKGKKTLQKDNSTLEVVRNTSITSETKLSAVEFTDTWYNKKDKTWYCVAFIERKNIWEKYEPELRDSRDNFKAFCDKAEVSEESFEKIKLLSMAREQGENFLEKYSYAQFLSEKLTSSNYGDSLLQLSSLKSSIQNEKNKIKLSLTVSKDVGDKVFSAMSQVLSENGFTISKSGNTHNVECQVMYNEVKEGDIFVYNPSVIVVITKDKEILYTYSKSCGRIKVFSTAVGEKKSVEAIYSVLMEKFNEDFNSALSGIK